MSKPSLSVVEDRSSAPSGAPREAALRVLYVEANEDGTVGGSHQALLDLVRYLDRDLFEPVVLFYQDNALRTRFEDLDIETILYQAEREEEIGRRLSGGRWRKAADFAGAIVRRARVLRAWSIDLVHINNSPRIGCDDWLPACRLVGIPIVASARGDAGGEPTRWRRFFFRRFDVVMPVSAWLAGAMKEAGVPESRIRVVRDGVDAERLRASVSRSADAVRSELGVGPDALFILMVGNIRPWKGQDVLLEALAHLTPEERAGLHVVFAGSVEGNDEYFGELRRLEAALDPAPPIEWLGSRPDIAELFAAADLSVHCSTIPEPFGLVVTEAMAVGTPVAAADRGGPTEVMTPECGWLHDPADPRQLAGVFREALGQPVELRRRGAAARERALDFSARRTATEMAAVYRGLVRPRSRALTGAGV
jgi:glycosyltransferase involved in cell wall biosynthesis